MLQWLHQRRHRCLAGLHRYVSHGHNPAVRVLTWDWMHAPSACTPGTFSTGNAPCSGTRPPFSIRCGSRNSTDLSAASYRSQRVRPASSAAKRPPHALRARASAQAQAARLRVHATLAMRAPARARRSCAPVLVYPAVFGYAHIGTNANALSRPACTAGTYAVAGASSCSACPTGSTSAAAASTCTCLGGYSGAGIGSSLECTGPSVPGRSAA
jgi:hypothetical protein